jgi:glycosyltransferase involved in cell wall biosynthesis
MGLMAAKRVGAYTVSYIPMAHPVRIAGNPFLTAFRDSINRRFYSLPDRIITISEGARRMLIERGATPNIVVVPNGVESRGIQQSDRQEFREALKIEKKQFAITILGRISFKQKGQDFAVRAISRFRSELENFRFLIVGSGPDAPKLRSMISELDLNPQVQVLPWEDDPKGVYAGTDMLLIPSRFEGVPLVMLEAMSAGLPIVATNVDIMPELLPKDWLFPYGDSKALIDTLRYVATRDNTHILESHKRRVATEFTMASFRSKFINAVLGGLRPSRG